MHTSPAIAFTEHAVSSALSARLGLDALLRLCMKPVMSMDPCVVIEEAASAVFSISLGMFCVQCHSIFA